MTPDQAYANLSVAIQKHGAPICQTTDPECWYPEPGISGTSREMKWAIEQCQACPVRMECLTFALVNREEYGIWGGLSVRARQAITRGHLTLKEVFEGKRLPRQVRIKLK